MRETDATIARMWADHTSREIGTVIGRSAEYVRVRAQRLDLPKKRETRGGWQRKANSALPAISNRGTTVRRMKRQIEAPAPKPQRTMPKPPPQPQRLWASPPVMRFTTCQWMLGKRCNAPTKDGSPWCDEHYRRVYPGKGAANDD